MINTLKEKGSRNRRVFVHTDGLEEIHPFGRMILGGRLFECKRINPSIFFIGDHAENLAMS